PLEAGLHRRQVGLEEVPVVERVLLRPERTGHARAFVEVAGLLHQSPALREDPRLAIDLEMERALERPDRVQVLDLHLGPVLGGAARPHRDVRVTAERTLLHADVRYTKSLERLAQLQEVRPRL